jgi:hypothetical protein
MPANLNALIRYKTIDRLLSTGRKYALSELVKHCSEHLGESRGMYKTISKRTVQEDIRILRSDILGFNAPIKNSFGKYYYEERNYSIFNTGVSNIDILKRVFDFLLSVRNEMSDDRLDKLLVDLSDHIPEREYFDINNEPAKAKAVKEPEKIIEAQEEEMDGVDFCNSPRRISDHDAKLPIKPKRAAKPAPKKAPRRSGDTIMFRKNRGDLFRFDWREISEVIDK